MELTIFGTVLTHWRHLCTDGMNVSYGLLHTFFAITDEDSVLEGHTADGDRSEETWNRDAIIWNGSSCGRVLRWRKVGNTGCWNIESHVDYGG